MLLCLSQLVRVGSFNVACLQTEVILHVLSEKCGFLSPVKDISNFQARLGHSESMEAATCNSETRAHPWVMHRALARRKLTLSWNQPKLLPDFKKRKPDFSHSEAIEMCQPKLSPSNKLTPFCLLPSVYHLAAPRELKHIPLGEMSGAVLPRYA